MRIAVLNASISRRNGGVSEVARRLTQELVRLDAGPIDVLALNDADTDTDLPAWAPLAPRVFPTSFPRFYGYASGYLRAVHSFDPELCHVHGLWLYPSLAARRWSQAAARPYLVTIHGMLDAWALANSRWKKRLAAMLFERANLQKAHCLQATTEAELRAIRDFGLRNPVCLIPNAVDLPPLDEVSDPSPWADAVPPDKKVLLYLGRIHPKKGLPALLDAWRSLGRESAKANDWMLVVAGWDQHGHHAELQQQAAQLGIGNRCVFPGPLFGIAKAAAFAHANAFVLPSLSEGLPLVVLEAWAHRRPVLMTQACNLPRGFQLGAALEMAPEAGSISRALNELVEMSDAERHRMGELGRAFVEREFTWPRLAREMVAVYRWMLGGGLAPSCVSALNDAGK